MRKSESRFTGNEKSERSVYASFGIGAAKLRQSRSRGVGFNHYKTEDWGSRTRNRNFVSNSNTLSPRSSSKPD